MFLKILHVAIICYRTCTGLIAITSSILYPRLLLSQWPSFRISQFWVGACAGGLETFKQFIAAILVDCRMVYILVQHLDPSHENKLKEVLSRVAKIKVNEITDEIHPARPIIFISSLKQDTSHLSKSS